MAEIAPEAPRSQGILPLHPDFIRAGVKSVMINPDIYNTEWMHMSRTSHQRPIAEYLSGIIKRDEVSFDTPFSGNEHREAQNNYIKGALVMYRMLRFQADKTGNIMPDITPDILKRYSSEKMAGASGENRQERFASMRENARRSLADDNIFLVKELNQLTDGVANADVAYGAADVYNIVKFALAYSKDPYAEYYSGKRAVSQELMRSLKVSDMTQVSGASYEEAERYNDARRLVGELQEVKDEKKPASRWSSLPHLLDVSRLVHEAREKQEARREGEQRIADAHEQSKMVQTIEPTRVLQSDEEIERATKEILGSPKYWQRRIGIGISSLASRFIPSLREGYVDPADQEAQEYIEDLHDALAIGEESRVSEIDAFGNNAIELSLNRANYQYNGKDVRGYYGSMNPIVGFISVDGSDDVYVLSRDTPEDVAGRHHKRDLVMTRINPQTNELDPESKITLTQQEPLSISFQTRGESVRLSANIDQDTLQLTAAGPTRIHVLANEGTVLQRESYVA